MGLGVFVLSRRPWTILTVAFAVTVVARGLFFAVANIAEIRGSGYSHVQTAFGLLAAAGMWVLIPRFPRPLADRPPLTVPLVVSVILTANWVAYSLLHATQVDVTLIVRVSVRALVSATLNAFIVYLAILYPRLLLAQARDRKIVANAAAGLMAISALGAGLGAWNAVRPPIFPENEVYPGATLVRYLVPAMFLLVVAVWWAVQARLSPDGRLCRNVSLTGSALLATGALLGVLFGHRVDGWGDVESLGQMGLARIVAVGLLAYGILRYGMFDLDVRMKTTLRRSTVAGVFLAVLFVVANIAQNYLGRYGIVVGGAAAGLLFFAMNPLQRMAERVANSAMPEVRPEDPAYIDDQKRETYRSAFMAAWADGVLTAKDQSVLASLRSSLGLPAADYAAIEAAAAPRVGRHVPQRSSRATRGKPHA